MIAAFAEAMMRQAGLKDNAKPVASHVINILLRSFADGEIFSRTQSSRVSESSVLLLCITSTKTYIKHITKHPVAQTAHMAHKNRLGRVDH